jgi:type IV secretory pathway VirJ component
MFCENSLRLIGAGGLCSLHLAAAAAGSTAAPESFAYGRFGDITVYRGSVQPRGVVLFLSGDGGWNLGVIAMAQRLADKGALVAGIDTRHYLAELEKATESCVSPALELEDLSHHLQSAMGIRHPLQPTLVGYSSGATLVYVALGEAPDAPFMGGLSLGFCPDLELKKPLCAGSGIRATPRLDSKGVLKGVDLMPARIPPGKWIALQGETDQVCPAQATQDFVATVAGAQFVMLPKVGHGYSVAKNWVPQYEAAYDRLTAVHRDEPAPP